jgi:hypothetical protein
MADLVAVMGGSRHFHKLFKVVSILPAADETRTHAPTKRRYGALETVAPMR